MNDRAKDDGRQAERGGTARPRWIKVVARWSPLAIVITGVVAVAATGLADQVSISTIIMGRADLMDFVAERPATAVAVYVGVYITAIVLSIPGGSLLTVVGGTLFGGVLGGMITVVAVTAGSVVVFLVARVALAARTSRWIERRGRRVRRFVAGIRINAFFAVYVLRLVPMLPFWASNAVPGVLGVRLTVFAAATFLGLLPWTTSFSFFGATLGEIIAAQELASPGCAAAGTCTFDYSALSAGPIVLGIAVAGLSLLPLGLYWLWRRREPPRG